MILEKSKNQKDKAHQRIRGRFIRDPHCAFGHDARQKRQKRCARSQKERYRG